MKHAVKSSELRQMSPERQEEAVRKLVRAANSQPNGEIRNLDQQIHALEEKFGLSSEDLRRELALGSGKRAGKSASG